jgi:hypothetical protein
VRARLVERPQDWPWSSLRAHLAGTDDGLVTVAPLIERLGRITALIDTEPEATALAQLRAPRKARGVRSAATRSSRGWSRCSGARCGGRKPGRKGGARLDFADLFQTAG